jgi:16S rRNA (adenine1518-N6/adenine1519-N6)-dimethyltransferase
VLAELQGERFSLVANLPYQAATPLMATLVERHPECVAQSVTIQREVADRLAAPAGSEHYGPISVTMALLAEVELVSVLAPGCFWPAPKVTSAMIAIRPRVGARPVADWPGFSGFVQRTFGQRRKQLGSILGRDAVAAAGFDPMRRPETLSPQEWVALHAAMGTGG